VSDPTDPSVSKTSPDYAAFFTGHPFALAVFESVRDLVASIGSAEIRTTRSQVAFRRRRGFAYLWLPGRWLAHPAAEVVLSIALGREDPSERWKQVAHPSKAVWMHHLEVRDLAELDDEIHDWLREAFVAAA
jgi:hypothetical protein